MDQLSYGAAQFKVKYREVDLHIAPGATTSALGTLKKGAVVTIIDDEDRYYYKVRLDNGLEGYVYKPAGIVSQGMTPTRMAAVETVTTDSNGATPPTLAGPTTSLNGLNGRTNGRPAPRMRPMPTATSRNGSSNGLNGGLDISSAGSVRRSSGRTLVIQSAEIAVFDKPGIVGRQVAKLKRGNEVGMVGQDSFFYQVELPGGETGFIPRYSAELR